jgi:predicted Zn-dependent protease
MDMGSPKTCYLSKATLIGLLVLSVGCATVPVTGRKSLNLLPDSELLSMSLQQYDDVLKKSKLSNEPAKVRMVKRVGERIASATEQFFKENGMESEIKNYKWEFNLIEDNQVVNAWCMPGGKVAVYTGILPLTQTDTGLAVVMGHRQTRKRANEPGAAGATGRCGSLRCPFNPSL